LSLFRLRYLILHPNIVRQFIDMNVTHKRFPIFLLPVFFIFNLSFCLAQTPVIYGPASCCIGSAVTLSDSLTDGHWYSIDTGIAVIDSNSGIVTGHSAGNDSICYVLSGDTVYTVITVDTVLNGVHITGRDSVCVGASVSLTAGIPGGFWFGSNLSASDSLGIVTGLLPGRDTVFFALANACGADTASMSILVLSPTDAGTIAGSNICLGVPASFSDSVAGGVWVSKNGLVVISSSGIVTGLQRGTDTISYTVSGFCGSASAIYPTVIDSFPTASEITGQDSICTASPGTFSDSIAGGTWYCYNPGVALSSADSITVFTAGFKGIDTLIYVVTNFCGSVSVEKKITVDSLSRIPGIIAATDSVCPTVSIHVSDSLSGGVWNLTNSNASFDTGSIVGIISGYDTLEYSVSNFCGVSVVQLPVKILSLPVSGLIGGNNICMGDTIIFTETASGGAWKMYNSRATIDSFGEVISRKPGLDTVTYTVSNYCGRSSSYFYFSIDSPLNVPIIFGNSRVCIDGTDTVVDKMHNGIWTVNDTNAAIMLQADTFAVVLGKKAGADTIYYLVQNQCGTYHSLKPITIDSNAVLYPILGRDSVCEAAGTGQKDTLKPNQGVLSWKAVNNKATLTPSASNTVSVFGSYPGVDTIIFTCTNGCGSFSVSKQITVNPLPDAGKILGPPALCIGDTLTYYDSTANCSGYWNTGIMSADSLSCKIIAGGLGNISVIFLVTNVCGSKKASVNLEVQSVPDELLTTGPKDICIGATETLKNSLAGGRWSVSNSSATIDSMTGEIKGVMAGIDTITYEYTNSCGTGSSAYSDTIVAVPPTKTIQRTENLLHVDSGFATYQWTLNGIDLPGAVFDSVTALQPGVYEVWVGNKFGCKSLSTYFDVHEIYPCTVSQLKVYPNPVFNEIYFKWCDYVNVNISTIEGRLILVENHATRLDLSGLMNGAYILHLTDDRGNNILNKIITKM